MQVEQSIFGNLVRENMVKVRCFKILVHRTNHSGPPYSITINSSESTIMRIDGSESKSDIKTAGSLEGACQPFYIVCAL